MLTQLWPPNEDVGNKNPIPLLNVKASVLVKVNLYSDEETTPQLTPTAKPILPRRFLNIVNIIVMILSHPWTLNGTFPQLSSSFTARILRLVIGTSNISSAIKNYCLRSSRLLAIWI